MLTQRSIVLVVIMFVGFTALVISYRWRKSRMRTPVVSELPNKPNDQRNTERYGAPPQDTEKSVAQWLVERDIRLKGGSYVIDADDIARRPQLRVDSVEFASGKQVTPEVISKLKRLSNLNIVSCYDTSVSDEKLTMIVELVNISELNLNYTDVTDAGLAKLASLPNLAKLSLNGTRVTDEGLAALRTGKLRNLSLYGTAVTDEGLGELAKMPQLLVVDVQNTKVTQEGVSLFQESRTPRYIYSDPY